MKEGNFARGCLWGTAIGLVLWGLIAVLIWKLV